MGTKNLTVVISNNKHLIAQYCQWDGYPDGQGQKALEFANAHLGSPESRDAFKDRLARCRFVEDGEITKLYEVLEIPLRDGMVNYEDGKKFNKTYPSLGRDLGAGILQHVWDAQKEVPMTDSYNFVADSLFCEWVYLVDLDNNTFEVYKGFNKAPLDKSERFYSFNDKTEVGGATGDTYYPVKLAKRYSLDQLPTETQFCADFKVD